MIFNFIAVSVYNMIVYFRIIYSGFREEGKNIDSVYMDHDGG